MKTRKNMRLGLVVSILLGLSACTSGNLSHQKINDTERLLINEKLYRSTSNYSQLVNLYRKILSNPELKNENERYAYLYKLSEAYFLKRDYESALLYLRQLYAVPSYKKRAMILELKVLVEMEKYEQSIVLGKQFLTLYPPQASVLNSLGIAYAELGKFEQAKESFNQARSYFLNDVIALNNLAMLEIIEGNYKNAVQLLLPQYLNGEKNQQLLFNLVFALVKVGDETYAKKIIEKESISTDPAMLIRSLRKTERGGN